jgi:hypothetical protein
MLTNRLPLWLILILMIVLTNVTGKCNFCDNKGIITRPYATITVGTIFYIPIRRTCLWLNGVDIRSSLCKEAKRNNDWQRRCGCRNRPTKVPIKLSLAPTKAPVIPTLPPTKAPVIPTFAPTKAPVIPTRVPTKAPVIPTRVPTSIPTKAPVNPTFVPTKAPVIPTFAPTKAPVIPTCGPTVSNPRFLLKIQQLHQQQQTPPTTTPVNR